MHLCGVCTAPDGPEAMGVLHFSQVQLLRAGRGLGQGVDGLHQLVQAHIAVVICFEQVGVPAARRLTALCSSAPHQLH